MSPFFSKHMRKLALLRARDPQLYAKMMATKDARMMVVEHMLTMKRLDAAHAMERGERVTTRRFASEYELAHDAEVRFRLAHVDKECDPCAQWTQTLMMPAVVDYDFAALAVQAVQPPSTFEQTARAAADMETVVLLFQQLHHMMRTAREANLCFARFDPSDFACDRRRLYLTRTVNLVELGARTASAGVHPAFLCVAPPEADDKVRVDERLGELVLITAACWLFLGAEDVERHLRDVLCDMRLLRCGPYSPFLLQELAERARRRADGLEDAFFEHPTSTTHLRQKMDDFVSMRHVHRALCKVLDGA